MSHLTVIEGTSPPDTPKQRVLDRVNTATPDAMISCRRCGGCEVLMLLSGVRHRKGKLVGGTKIAVCANCHRNGERVVLA